MKRLLHIACWIICPFIALAQEYYITGHVKDESGKPLQNVTILVASTGYVYYTGLGGAFGITVTSKTDTVIFSYEGYLKFRVPAVDVAGSEIFLKKAPRSRNASAYRLASSTQNLKRELQQQWFSGDETYASLVENRYINANAYPATGVTLNVDKASYSNIRRFLATGNHVPPDAVRIEEMLNYFNLSYREPPGNRTFDIHSQLTQCPWKKGNALLFTQVFSKKLDYESLPPSHLVFLIDVSASMDMPNRLPLLKNGFKALINNLRPIDSVSIVVYGGTVGVAMPTTGGGNKQAMLRAIDSLQAGGNTPGESGIKLAYSVARNHFIKGGNNRIILATDGDFNVGLKTDEELEALIAAQRKTGVYLTCLGIGMGNYKDSKIQTLAQQGNGNFAYLDSYAEAEKVLLKEFAQTLYSVADDAYLKVKFNPDYVKEYRLIGFDNKMGAIKDTAAMLEGGEIGSAYSVMVVFEVVPAVPIESLAGKTLENGFVTYNLNYKLVKDNSKALELSYTPQVKLEPLQSVAPGYRFASSLIMFGGLLKASPYFKEITWNNISELAASSIENDNFSQGEFLSLIQQAKTIYSKKRKKTEN